MQTNTRKVVTSDAKWHPHLLVLLAACFCHWLPEIYFEERIISYSGTGGFGLIVPVINMADHPCGHALIALPALLFIPKALTALLAPTGMYSGRIAGLFIAYPVGR
ncbi:hypothetical protein KCP78_11955 [Salmonella enterica subsp. enterica]|nr:hypothetical protein KCP78_11955 [Salmonella enterica subsp. enterica]